MTIAFGRGTGQRFGSGWISGVLSVTFGALGYGGVLCLLFPSLLTTPDARPLYPIDRRTITAHSTAKEGVSRPCRNKTSTSWHW